MEVEGSRSRGEKRTFKDAVLISAWIAAYAGVLFIFRAAKAVESVLSNKP
jgi:hypothetical protein